MLKKEGRSVAPVEIANRILGQLDSPPYIEKVCLSHNDNLYAIYMFACSYIHEYMCNVVCMVVMYSVFMYCFHVPLMICHLVLLLFGMYDVCWLPWM